MISMEMLKKYNMLPLEEYKAMYGDSVDTEKTFYETFLAQTDHIPLKIIEAYTVFMVDNNVNVGNMKKFFADVKEQYGEILEARKFAREEINRIESETATE